MLTIRRIGPECEQLLRSVHDRPQNQWGETTQPPNPLQFARSNSISGSRRESGKKVNWVE